MSQKRWYLTKYCPVLKTHVEKSDGCELFKPVQELVELKEEQKRCLNCQYFGKKEHQTPPFMRC